MTTRAGLSPAIKRVLAALLRLGKGGEPRGDGYRMQCPAHDDHAPSLDIDVGDDGRALIVCRVGCAQDQVLAALGIPAPQLFLTRDEQATWQGVGGYSPETYSSSSSVDDNGNNHQDLGSELGGDLKNTSADTSAAVGLTLDQYAEAKRLPKEFLQRLGLSTVYLSGTPVVSTPYKDGEGVVRAVQFRQALAKGDHEDGRFSWSRKGTKPLLYGLWRTEALTNATEMVIVEGASDCQTLWWHDIPALGLPGADSWREEWAKALDGYERVYIIREPDAGGKAVEKWVTQSGIRHRVWYIDLDRFKDPSGLYLDDPERFTERWAYAVSRATSWADAYHARVLKDVSRLYGDIKPLLEAPDLLDQLRTAIRDMGYVGDAWAPMLVYLILTSRLLDRPMNGAVIGPPSVGKNVAVDIAREFLPTEEFHAFEASSPLALIYDDADLRHKAVLVGELDSLPDDGPAGSAIRSLAQNNQTVYDVVEKDSKSGKFRTRRICRDGPTVLLTTGTKSPAPQLQTRMLELHLQDDPHLTHAIIDRQSDERSLEVLKKPDLQPWKDLQKWLALQASRVRIPFAKAIARALRERVKRPPTRLRRDYPKLLTCIEAITLLYQCQRSRTSGGDLIATLGDYNEARALLEPVIGTIVHDGVTAAIRETVAGVVDLLGTDPPDSQSVSEAALAKHLNLSKTATQYRVRRCLAGGWLANREERKGRAAQLVLGVPLPDDGPILPPVEEVERYWKGSAPSHGSAPSVGQSVNNAVSTENGDMADRPGGHWTREPILGHPIVHQVNNPVSTEIADRTNGLEGLWGIPAPRGVVEEGSPHFPRAAFCRELEAFRQQVAAEQLGLSTGIAPGVLITHTLDCSPNGHGPTEPNSPGQGTDPPAQVEVCGGFEPPEIHYIDSVATLHEHLPHILTAPVVGIDTETTGLNPLKDRVRTIQLATHDRTLVVDAYRVPVDALAPVCNGGRWLIAQHAKFDWQMLVKAGLPYPAGKCFDPMLGAMVLSASRSYAATGTYALEGLAEHFLGVSLDKALQTSAWDRDLSAEHIRYAALDAAILLPLTKVLQQKLKDASLWRVAELEGSCTRPVAWLELAGMPVDREAWAAQAQTQAAVSAALAADLNSLVGVPVNWQSPKQLLALLKDHGIVVDSTGEEVLAGHVDNPLVRALLEYRHTAQLVKTFGEKWLRYVDPMTGRVHADFHQLGSVAGRFACSKPNLQQIPRTSSYRAMFCVPEHRRLIKADYAQIELRLAAIMAPDRTMLDRFLADEDIHILTAATMLNLSPAQVTKEHRQLAKALNFGLLYGMGAPRLQSHAWKDYHVALTEAEAVQRRQQWLRLYKGIERWHQRTGQHKQLDTRTLLGRRRLGITRFTEMLNTPVQGSGADGLKLAMVRVFDDRHRYPDVQLVNVVHDELLFECDAHHAEEVGAWVKHHMEAAMQEVVQGKVPTPVDVMIGQSWAG